MIDQFTNRHSRSAVGVRVVAGAGGLGLLGDILFRPEPGGVSLFLWLAALTGLSAHLIIWQRLPTTRDGRWLIATALGFAALLAVRDSETLRSLNFLAVLLALGLGFAALRSWPSQLRVAALSDYALTCLYTAVHALAGAIPLTVREIAWRRLPGGRFFTASAAIVRGLLIAVPLLLLFGGLFMSADAVFEQGVYRAFKWNPNQIFSHVFVASLLSWIAAGTLRAVVQDEGRGPLPSFATLRQRLPDAAGESPKAPTYFSLGFLELATVIGLLDALFLAFVLVQVRYLFGGAAVINPETGLTYAEYARRGFFELVTVAALALPLLLTADALLRAANPVQTRAFRWLSGLMVLLLAIVMLSAVQRMRLYQDIYGLTELRLYTTAFMGWLGVLLVWFALTVLRGQRRRFAFGMLASGLVAVAVLNLIDPDATIVRSNAHHATLAGQADFDLGLSRFDTRYITSLSADAVPAVLEALPNAEPDERRGMARVLLGRWSNPGSQDWRSWSWSRARAHAAVASQAAQLKAYANVP